MERRLEHILAVVEDVVDRVPIQDPVGGDGVAVESKAIGAGVDPAVYVVPTVVVDKDRIVAATSVYLVER